MKQEIRDVLKFILQLTIIGVVALTVAYLTK